MPTTLSTTPAPTAADRLIRRAVDNVKHVCPICGYGTNSTGRFDDHRIIVHTLIDDVQWIEGWNEFAVRCLNGDYVTSDTHRGCIELKQEADRVWAEHQSKNMVGRVNSLA
jgi:hypothetical protein